ncbi:MAG: hypothetical protein IE933_11225 [Sphingomonadales bacterium]|nr:hypothetical protein [Sphingomonadales bacterium]MBD3774437.1 hypothetical protein [Paracoccaceae bacterium]
MKRAAIAGALLIAMFAVSTYAAPQLLAFPYEVRMGDDRVYSVAPVQPAEIAPILQRADGLLAESPIAARHEGRRIFLTDGGWRWYWLANRSAGGFALTRPVTEYVLVNRSDVADDKVFDGETLGGTRSLSGVIAHEKCHGAIRRHFGVMRSLAFPQMLVEGYCDYVAQESSLSDADVARLRAAGHDHPALPYYFGRRRVAAELARDGGSVDRLFAQWR